MTTADDTPRPAAEVTSEQLRAEELRQRYLEVIDRPDIFPTPTNWQYIIANAMTGLGPALYLKYLTALDLPDDDREPLHTAAIEYFPQYLRAVPRGYAAATVYSRPDMLPDAGLRLIRSQELFDPVEILRLLRSGHSGFALEAIDAYSSVYDADMLDGMRALAGELDALPEMGYREERRGLLGTSVKYICPRGHVNDGDRTYCRDCGCDSRGITESQAARIDTFRRRLRALEVLLDAE